jgi:ribosomal protein S18 acetylase RimI-like enzyme
LNGAAPKPGKSARSASAAVTVADCERVQQSWYDSCARAAGGESWQDGPLHWVWLAPSRSLMLMFPVDIPPDALDRGIAEAKQCKAREIGGWLGLQTDAAPLAEAGFEHGWSPWWMAARIEDVGQPDGARVRLARNATDVGANDQPLVRLIFEEPARNWHAVARVGERDVGHAWSHVHGELAGVFDMGVWPKFQRRGLGTELARTVCAAAAQAGARYAVLNATPEGEQLYRTLGFERLGDGTTGGCTLSHE